MTKSQTEEAKDQARLQRWVEARDRLLLPVYETVKAEVKHLAEVAGLTVEAEKTEKLNHVINWAVTIGGTYCQCELSVKGKSVYPGPLDEPSDWTSFILTGWHNWYSRSQAFHAKNGKLLPGKKIAAAILKKVAESRAKVAELMEAGKKRIEGVMAQRKLLEEIEREHCLRDLDDLNVLTGMSDGTFIVTLEGLTREQAKNILSVWAVQQVGGGA